MMKKAFFLIFVCLFSNVFLLFSFCQETNLLFDFFSSFSQKLEAKEGRGVFFHEESNISAVFRTHASDNSFFNFYIDDLNISFARVPVISDIDNPMMELLREVTKRDRQVVNHLFLEAKVLLCKKNGEIDVKSSVLKWDKIHRKLTFLSRGNETPIVDFVSRNYVEGDDLVNQKKIYYLLANSHPSALYDHSEALFFGLLFETKDVFADFLSSIHLRDGEKISQVVLVYYSSLDSCDRCQSLVHQFYSKWDGFSVFSRQLKMPPFFLSLRQIFVSCYPCKRSSYKVFENKKKCDVSFDKGRQAFFKDQKPFVFIANKDIPDLKGDFFSLITYIDSIAKGYL